MKLHGRVWRLGDDVGVLDLLPARYDNAGIKAEWAECARHLLEDMVPGFAAAVQPGDLVIAGTNLGIGHAHFYRATVMACHAAGIGALLADSTHELFQRAAIDAGIPVWSYPGISAFANTGETVRMDLQSGLARNLTTGRELGFKPLSPIILDILAAGGSFEWSRARAARRAEAPTGARH